MGQCTHRHEVYAGAPDCPERLERDAAAGLKLGAPGDLGDRRAQLLDAHVVEQEPRRAGRERPSISAASAPRPRAAAPAHARAPPHRRGDPAGHGDVVLLDQHRVVEAEAVVDPPPAATAAFSSIRRPGRRLARSRTRAPVPRARRRRAPSPSRCPTGAPRKFKAVRSAASSARRRRRRPGRRAPASRHSPSGPRSSTATPIEQREGQQRRLHAEDHAGRLLHDPRRARAAAGTVACSSRRRRRCPPERPRDELATPRRSLARRPEQVRSHERVEVAVEHALHVPGLVAGAQVLDDRVRVHDVVADLRAEVTSCASPFSRAISSARRAPRARRASRGASPSPSPCWRTASARSGTARRSRSGGA